MIYNDNNNDGNIEDMIYSWGVHTVYLELSRLRAV